MKMVSAVQVSIDVRWFETILALLAIVSADSSSLEVDPIPLKMGDTHFWQNQRIPNTSMRWFSARKMAAQVLKLSGWRKHPQPIDILVQAGEHSF
ncbi:hypothetical protein [Nitrosomonas sp.]|uniref:hypothetical protein n=1 Tax=Nitrosomonas sp. TaxID=42353 RepID=UPI00374DB1A3